MIARLFGWKVYQPPTDHISTFRWLDTGREIFSLPHFNHAAGPLVNYDDVAEELAGLQLLVKKPLGIRLPALAEEAGVVKMVSVLPLAPGALPVQLVHGDLARKIRLSYKRGLVVVRHGVEAAGLFHSIYCRRLHQLGSAPLPLRFFEALGRNYPDKSLDAEVLVHLAFHQGRVVGGAFSLRFGQWFENGWFATDVSNPSLYVAYALHQSMITDAVSSGAMLYSFGRSTPGGGVHRFKKQWGTIDIPIHLIHYPPKNFDARNHRCLSVIWKRTPAFITNRINPYLAKWLY